MSYRRPGERSTASSVAFTFKNFFCSQGKSGRSLGANPPCMPRGRGGAGRWMVLVTHEGSIDSATEPIAPGDVQRGARAGAARARLPSARAAAYPARLRKSRHAQAGLQPLC
eukprot:scaffold77581_cov31-Tisochrysis_lutea.AAC.3